MPGGLIQLVAYGSQNIYLNGNPSLSFFKKVYKTHTNFATESIRLNFNKNVVSFREPTHLIAKVDRNGDLISNIYFSFTLPDVRKRYHHDNDQKIGHKFRYVENLGEVFIKEYYIYIGGNVVDKQYGEWLHIWSELTLESSKRYGYEKLTGNVPEIYRPDDYDDYEHGEIQVPSRKIMVPLLFWFNRMPGLALPLIALQYHEIEIHIELRPFRELVTEDGALINDVSLYFDNVLLNIDPYLECNYVFLDTEERAFFANNSLDYLIEQVTLHPYYELNQHNILDLTLQNPVKEIIWVIGRDDRVLRNKWYEYGDKSYRRTVTYINELSETKQKVVFAEKEVLVGAKFTFNGLDRLEEKDAAYYNLVQPYQHHTVVPKQGVYVYSFSLYPERFQPSGACNMSRINNIQLHLTLEPPSESSYNYEVNVYVVNYNFLRVTAGLAGVAFAC
jgi:hypothetical protein